MDKVFLWSIWWKVHPEQAKKYYDFVLDSKAKVKKVPAAQELELSDDWLNLLLQFEAIRKCISSLSPYLFATCSLSQRQEEQHHRQGQAQTAQGRQEAHL